MTTNSHLLCCQEINIEERAKIKDYPFTWRATCPICLIVFEMAIGNYYIDLYIKYQEFNYSIKHDFNFIKSALFKEGIPYPLIDDIPLFFDLNNIPQSKKQFELMIFYQ